MTVPTGTARRPVFGSPESKAAAAADKFPYTEAGPGGRQSRAKCGVPSCRALFCPTGESLHNEHYQRVDGKYCYLSLKKYLTEITKRPATSAIVAAAREPIAVSLKLVMPNPFRK